MIVENKPKLSRKHVNKIIDWCVKTYGKSKYNRTFPTIKYRKPDYTTEGMVAYYDEDEHVIFIDNVANDTLEELVNSIIHEYIHYKQNMKHYRILSQYLPDSKHPLEIEAYRIANRDTKKCLKEVFSI